MSSHPFETNEIDSTGRGDDPGRSSAGESFLPLDYAGQGVAIAGRGPGREGWTGAVNGDGLGTFLGWFSIGLGAAELLAPHQVSRAIGLRPSPATTAVLQAFGLREVATGWGILANPTSKEWVGARIGGDVLDLAMLGVALARAERPGRTALAAAFVMGAGVLDLLGAERLAERRKATSAAQGAEPEPVVLRSVTVGRPVTEVFAFWRDLGNLPRFMQNVDSIESLGEKRSRWRASGPAGTTVEWESEITEERENELIAWRSVDSSDLYHSGRVQFRPAPREEGTIVSVEMQYAPPGGRIGAALLKLFGQEPGQQLATDLRRFKQLMETGEVLLSDASAVKGPAAGRPHDRSELR